MDHPIAFASRNLFKAEKNYSITKDERLAMVYALQKFRHYLLGGHFWMCIDHCALKCLVKKPVLGGKICRWLLLFQKYDFEVIVNPERLNVGLDHLSWIEIGEEQSNLEEGLLDVHLFAIHLVDRHFVDIIHFLSTGMAFEGYTKIKRNNFSWVQPIFRSLWDIYTKINVDEILWRYVLDFEHDSILVEAHGGVVGGHYARREIAQKTLRIGLWWPKL